MQKSRRQNGILDSRNMLEKAFYLGNVDYRLIGRVLPVRLSVATSSTESRTEWVVQAVLFTPRKEATMPTNKIWTTPKLEKLDVDRTLTNDFNCGLGGSSNPCDIQVQFDPNTVFGGNS